MPFPRTEKKLPVVVIVGRPNVGKSTLFNRLAGKRIAITDALPGVTRDPVDTTCTLSDRTVRLVDTGGYRLEGADLDRVVSDRSLAMVREADLILLVLDVQELTPEDESFIERLRPFADWLVLVVNKVDNSSREQAMWNYLGLGFQYVVGISAAHGTNMDELELLIRSRLSGIGTELPAEEGAASAGTEAGEQPAPMRIAILGKPNTGKSTLANRLLGSERSIVSDVPGTTRDVLEGRFRYRDTEFLVLDTAGIRRKSRVGEDIEYYSVNRAIATIQEADVVFLVIDVAEGLSDQDKKIAAQIVKRGVGIILVMNKWDLLDRKPNTLEAVTDRVRFLFPTLEFAPILPASALEGEGVEKLLQTALRIRQQLDRRVDTSTLNEHLQKWMTVNPPPSGRLRYRIRYATQVSIRPIKFLLFVNRKKGFPAAYVQYVKNRIRKDLGFNHIPFDVELRE